MDKEQLIEYLKGLNTNELDKIRLEAAKYIWGIRELAEIICGDFDKEG